MMDIGVITQLKNKIQFREIVSYKITGNDLNSKYTTFHGIAPQGCYKVPDDWMIE